MIVLMGLSELSQISKALIPDRVVVWKDNQIQNIEYNKWGSDSDWNSVQLKVFLGQYSEHGTSWTPSEIDYHPFEVERVLACIPINRNIQI
jgi:hypothetical protein